MAQTYTDTNVNQLVINKMTKQEYDNLSQVSETELYLVEEQVDNVVTQNSTNPVQSGAVYNAIKDAKDVIMCNFINGVPYITEITSLTSMESDGSDGWVEPGTSTAISFTEGEYYIDIDTGDVYCYQDSELVDVSTSVNITPSTENIYVDNLTNYIYRWNGTAYVQVGGSEDVSDSTVTFTDDSTTFDPSTDNVQSGGLLSTLFQKIKKWFSNLGDLAFINKDGDTSNKYLKGDGTWGNPSSEFTGTIGGLNLVYGSASMHSGSDVYSWRESGGTVSTQSISSDTSRPLSNFNTCIRCTNGGSSATNIGIAQDGHHVSFKAGDKLTQSLWIRVSTAGSYSVAFQPYYSSDSSYSQGCATLDLTTDWTRISYTTNIVGGISGTASVGYFYIHSAPVGFYFEACGMKVENGDTPTDWTPAPQDIFLKEDGLPEAELVWGGKNFSGDFGPLDAALVSELGANRLAFANASGITIEYSRNAGSTWTDYGATDVQKLALTSVLGYSAFAIGKADSTNKATANGTNYQLRITIDTSSSSIYTELKKLVIYVSTNGSSASNVTIQKATHGSQSAFVTQVSDVPLSGWSGYNVINLNPFITTYGNRDDHYQKLRFIFKANGGSTSYTGLNVYNIFGYGGMGWIVPSSLAKTGHIYSYDPNKNVSFPAQVTATTFDGKATKVHVYEHSANNAWYPVVWDNTINELLHTTNKFQFNPSLGTLKLSSGGLNVCGRTQGSGDDEGIVIATCSNNSYAALTLAVGGDPETASGKYHSTFYLKGTGSYDMFWRASVNGTIYDIQHPKKSGTIALTSDIPDLTSKSYNTSGGSCKVYKWGRMCMLSFSTTISSSSGTIFTIADTAYRPLTNVKTVCPTGVASTAVFYTAVQISTSGTVSYQGTMYRNGTSSVVGFDNSRPIEGTICYISAS